MADLLREIATLLELKGENPFKTRAYRNGADVVESYPGDIVADAAEDRLKGTKGIGDALQQKLQEYASTGELGYYDNLRAEFPETIFELFEIQGLGPKKIKALYSNLGVASIARLKEVAESGEAASMSGFGKKTCEKILEAIEFREQNASRFRLNDVAPHVEEILEFLQGHPQVARAEVAGSYRRGKETVGDLDFIAETKAGPEVIGDFVKQEFCTRVIVEGGTKASINLESGVQVDLRCVSTAEFPFTLAYFTGSKEHNVALRARALEKGLTLNEYRLAPKGEDEPAPGTEDIRDEKGIYDFLGLDFVDPELRENGGEIEAAEKGKLPNLIEKMNLRGTFHNHTRASDGKATLEEMAAAAQELGLQYLGIADHSKASFQANGLDEPRLRSQIAEIKKLNKGFDGFRIFTGTEVDILKDGSLDFDDELLAELDYSVASVHNAFTLPEKDMTKRLIRAIENPYVTMLGHLTGRLLLKREPYEVDVPAIIEACAATGTIIELNANPWRLDMDWRWWKLAKEKGVKCAINPDAHATAQLQFLHYGVLTARKGWLEKADVVNCLALGEIEAVLAAKRG